ncbi:MAG: tripartite tricarboxylate transporter substrate binding protein [Xanthobacteraceae bacterium]
MRLRLLLGVLAAIGWTVAANGQGFPNRSITLVVSFAPGGLTDIPARILAPAMQQRLGQPVVVENKAGASGVVGGSYVVHSAPDGYTLLVSGISEVQNFYYIHVPYKVLTDFSPVGMVAVGPPLVLIVNGKSPFKTLSDLIAYAKANPAKTNVSTTGPATSPAIAVSQLNSLAGIKMVAVPYSGSGPAATAVARGDVQAGFTFYPSAEGLAASGQVRVLAVASAHRMAILPNVPTMEELGFRNFDHDAFVGLLAPRETPASAIDVLNKALNQSIRSPDFAKRLEPFGMTVPAPPNSPVQYGQFLAKQIAYQGELAKLPGHLQQSH